MAIDVKPQHGTAGHRPFFRPGNVRADPAPAREVRSTATSLGSAAARVMAKRGGTFNQAALTLLVLAQLSWFIFLGYLVWIVV
jgi:hypothetical protein